MRYRNCELFLRTSLSPSATISEVEKIKPHLLHDGTPNELLDTIPNPSGKEQAVVIVIKPWEYLKLKDLLFILSHSRKNLWVYRLGNGFARLNRHWFVGYLIAYISDLWGALEDLAIAPIFSHLALGEGSK